MLREFRDFIAKGNILEIAVGFIMGAAFVALVAAFTIDILNPIIGAIVGKPTFDNTIKIGDGVIKVGAFITAVINFLIIAATAFFIMKIATNLTSIGRKPKEEIVDLTEKDVLVEIRDLLRSNRN